MPVDKAPAFQFYPKDFLADANVAQMSNTEIGIYLRLLCYCWLEGSLPLETEALARMAHMPLQQFTRLWEKSVLKSCFYIGDHGRIYHKRLDYEREKQECFKRRQSDSGTKGADRRWGRHDETMAPPSFEDGEASVEAMANHSSSSSSSSPSAFPSPVKNVLLERFARFWQAYPRRTGKDAAWKAWERRRPDDALLAVMVDAIAWQRLTPEWTTDAGKFIPYPATWLNQGRWQDEPVQPAAPTAVANKRVGNLIAGGRAFLGDES